MPRSKPVASLRLQSSEAVVVHAASRIFAALVAAGRVTEASRDEHLRFSVRAAIALARGIDRLLDSDDESGDTSGSLGPLG